MTKWRIAENVICFLFVGGTLGWVFWRTLKKTDDPVGLIVRWVVTVLLVGSMIKTSMPLIRHGAEISVVAGVLIAATHGIIISLFWARTWAEGLFKPLTNLFDGGDEEPELRPIYSRAEAKRQKGLYNDAVREIRKELDKFPNDFTGHMLLGQIQAENLNDLQGAQITIEKVINHGGLAPGNFAGALHQLADWHLKFGRDRDSAEQALQKIVEALPNTQFAQTAAQRIAHLPATEQLLKGYEPERVRLGHYEKYVGLKQRADEPVQTTEDPAQVASRYVQHLQQHPHDCEVREKLALIYAEYYRHIDMARREIETLIGQPGVSPKQIVRWLNLLADLQINVANDVAAAQRTIYRIETLFPATAHADQARMRVANLKTEAKRHEAQHTLKLGSYEKDLGLKAKPKV